MRPTTTAPTNNHLFFVIHASAERYLLDVLSNSGAVFVSVYLTHTMALECPLLLQTQADGL